MSAGERLLTIEEFGQRIGRSRAAAYNRVTRGEIEVVNIGSRLRPQLRVTEAAVRKYIESRRIPARSST